MYEDGVLYILIRKDMDSLNHTGKMVAQGAHAANHAADRLAQAKFGPENRAAWMAWEKSTDQAFGTTIVLGQMLDHKRVKKPELNTYRSPYRDLTIEDIRILVQAAIKIGYSGAIINDPTYPLLDGKTLHAFPCDTAGWIFGSKSGLERTLKDLELHGADASSGR